MVILTIHVDVLPRRGGSGCVGLSTRGRDRPATPTLLPTASISMSLLLLLLLIVMLKVDLLVVLSTLLLLLGESTFVGRWLII